MKFEITKEQKQAALNALVDQIERKILEIKSSIKELISGQANDSKSTAGDKHETSRAMMQLEVENLGRNLQNFENNLELVHRAGLVFDDKKIVHGSMIRLDKDIIYIIAPGNVEIINGEKYLFISPLSPLAKVLIGKGTGEVISFNNQTKKIIQII